MDSTPDGRVHQDDDAGQEEAGSLEAPETVGRGGDDSDDVDGDDDDTVD